MARATGQPIGALLCALRKQAYPSRFDHVAVVVVSPKDYTPMVLEAAHSRIKVSDVLGLRSLSRAWPAPILMYPADDHCGAQLRRYDERIASSRATRIHVRKLQCAVRAR